MPAFLDMTIDEPQLSSLTTLIHSSTPTPYGNSEKAASPPSAQADAQTRASHVLSATFLDALRHAADTLDRLLPLPQDPALRHPLATRALCLCLGGDVKIRKSGGAKLCLHRCVAAPGRVGIEVSLRGVKVSVARRRRLCIEAGVSLRGVDASLQSEHHCVESGTRAASMRCRGASAGRRCAVGDTERR
ncbi:hypothetical protein DFH09DRAFT_1382441 [Mycena vulgaris]|nr:hypothetical protein DFH09DRAFT_1382441 [Mycena vulgaris]